MATVTLPQLFFFFFFFISAGGGILRIAKGQAPGQGAWCVATPSCSDDQLNRNIKYVCEEVNIPCDIIQPGSPCFEPQTLINHASVVMNLYYQQYGRNHWNCEFNNSGLISVKDPSYVGCKYL